MKVLLVGPNSVHLRRYWDFVAPTEIQLRVITQAPEGGSRDWFGDLVPEQRSYLRFSLRNPLAFLRASLAIRAEAAVWGVDLIHAHQVNVYAFASFGAVLATGRPFVLSAYGSDIQSAPLDSLLLRSLVRYAIRRANLIIAESRSLIDEIVRLEPGASARCRRIPFPLPSPAQAVSPKEPLAYSNRLHEPLYRIDEVLRTMAVLRTRLGSGFCGVIAGEGSETGSLRRLATELGLDYCVEFVGWVDAQRNGELYDRSTYFISLPEQDAYSVSLQEAMQRGCVPIVSDLPCNRELVIHGTNGVILDRSGGGLEDLAEIDLQLAARLNRELVARTTSPERCVAAIIRAYHDAMDSAR